MLKIRSPGLCNSHTGISFSVNYKKLEKCCHFLTEERWFSIFGFCLSALLLQWLPQTFRSALVWGMQQDMSGAAGNTPLISSFDCTLGTMQHRLLVSNLFTTQLIMPKKDGGIRVGYETAMQYKKKKINVLYKLFNFILVLVWFGERQQVELFWKPWSS